jgi:predicted transcriptional regulator
MTYGAMMRTTVDLPEDLHRAATSLARDRGQSLSQTVSDLMRRALRPDITVPHRFVIDADAGLPVVFLGTPVTTEMVRAAVDEE